MSALLLKPEMRGAPRHFRDGPDMRPGHRLAPLQAMRPRRPVVGLLPSAPAVGPIALDQTVTGEPVMNAPHEPVTRPAPASGPVRRIAATVIMSGLVFLLLWLMAFSVFTSLLIAGGFCVVVVSASAASDLVVMLLDAIAAVVFGVLGAIAAFFGAIFSLFGS
jgi:hypothetical protein